MRALVTGATGLVGRRLLAALPGAVVLSRDPERARVALGAVDVRAWDPSAQAPSGDALRGVDVVFHLAGEPIAAGRWTEERKRRIRESRVVGTRHLVEGLAAVDPRPSVLVSASAIGVYGDRGDEVLDESSAVGEGFLAEVCAAWEAEATRAASLGMRVVCVRTGIVLARDGGALARMRAPFALGVGGRLGSGRQWMSWVHLEDVVGVMLHAARTPTLRGPVDAVAPQPVTNADFARALGRALGRPAFLPVPGVALRLVLGELSEVLLGSQRVLPRAAERSGYVFRHPELPAALAALLPR